ncbi:MAG: nucleotidyltransferase domain-containing protein, partial [Heliobacteriaceae bacterium]|nr:nucleotidyltransferase domain-containing protein [Heliobacteriaceae bacterium]
DFSQVHPEIQAIYLFGSRVSGRYRKNSDWDVAVLFDRQFRVPGDRPWLMEFYSQLCDALEEERVDFVHLNEAPLSLQFDCIRRHIKLYTRHPEDVAAYEARVITMYLDTQPLREARKQAVMRAFGVKGKPAW